MKKTSLFSLLFICFYAGFFVLYDFIHSGQVVDLENIVWWQRGAIFKEGNEYQIVFWASLVYMGLAFLISRFIRHPGNSERSGFRKLTLFLSLLPFLYILITTRSNTFSMKLEGGLLVGGSTLIILFILYRLRKYSKVIFFISWTVLITLILFGMGVPSFFDYDFFIGPALKLSQGEQLGAFYMQYGLGMTYLFKLFTDLNLRMYAMQIVLAAFTTLFFVLYYKLASKLLKDRILLFLFMGVLFSYRYLAIYYDPVRIPAVLPMRLDLWVILALISLRFGLFSFVTSLSFSIVYVLDNTFGAFYIVVYVAVMLEGAKRLIASKKILSSAKADSRMTLLLPIILSVLFNLYFFHSLTNPAGKLYQDLRFGFMPIFPGSLFWVVLFVLPYCIYLVSFDRDQFRKQISFLILGFFSLEMVYFYGRSHDTNFLNISGLFILILFLALQQTITAYNLKKIAYGVGVFLIVVSAVVFSDYYIDRFSRVVRHLSRFQIVEINNFDESIEQNRNMFAQYPANKVLILSQFDSYINYRMHIPQYGYLTPFPIHVFLNETIDFISDSLGKGYTVVYWENEIGVLIEQMNQRLAKTNAHFRFQPVYKGGFYEVTVRNL